MNLVNSVFVFSPEPDGTHPIYLILIHSFNPEPLQKEKKENVKKKNQNQIWYSFPVE